jgi:MraZ protein
MFVQSTFTGNATGSVDNKSRVAFPLCFRKALRDEEEEKNFFVTFHSENGANCLMLYTLGEWERQLEKMRESARTAETKEEQIKAKAILNYLSERGVTCGLDKQNRIALTPQLLEYAGIEKEVFFAADGFGRKIRVWAPDRYNALYGGSLEEQMEGLEDVLNQIF